MRPMTDRTPKCLIPIGDTTLIDIWLDNLHRAGVDEVLINLHHLADRVLHHLEGRSGPPVIRTAFEAELLGSAGTLRHHRAWVQDEDFFLAFNADNLTDFDVRRLIDHHRSGDAEATLTVFHAPDPSQCGVVDVDHSGLVVGFTEKPALPSGNLANAGMYAFDPGLLLEIEEEIPSDIGYQLLPRLIGRARALLVENYFCDIGTPSAYEQAVRDWRPRVSS
jgi:mannose-1-phosphate guanylyltransferase